MSRSEHFAVVLVSVAIGTVAMLYSKPGGFKGMPDFLGVLIMLAAASALLVPGLVCVIVQARRLPSILSVHLLLVNAAASIWDGHFLHDAYVVGIGGALSGFLIWAVPFSVERPEQRKAILDLDPASQQFRVHPSWFILAVLSIPPIFGSLKSL